MAKYRFDDKHTFINPYNFVPNGAKKTTVSEPSKNEQLHTGVLHCRLITKTPIIIPDTAERQKQKTKNGDHYKYPFMKIGEYAIPGSSIRGPIRSVYETMTNSCFAIVREDQAASDAESILKKVRKTYGACNAKENCCAACRMFGMAVKDAAAVGKVRFTDAIPKTDEAKNQDEAKNHKNRYKNLRELGMPHITYQPFYMENSREHGIDGVRIRGRKFYWHHKPDPELAETADLTNLNSTMESLDGGEFKFDVFYDQITQQQIKELMWVLCMGENTEDSLMRHKIGHAKPLGFGSVKIVIDKREERTYSAEEGYLVKELPVDEDDFRNIFEGRTDSDTMRAMLAMANFKTIPDEMQVRYPYVEASEEPEHDLKDNVLASHQWYSQNYKREKKGSKNKGRKGNNKQKEKAAAYKLASADAGAEKLLLPRLTASNFTDKDYVYYGVIKTKKEGYGFINPDEGGDDLYFHMSKAADFEELKENDKVSYQKGTGRNGKPCVVNVERCR